MDSISNIKAYLHWLNCQIDVFHRMFNFTGNDVFPLYICIIPYQFVNYGVAKTVYDLELHPFYTLAVNP